MRIGIVSDTHNQLRNVERIVELFNQTGVERVIHTGDITQAKVVALLGRLRMPVLGVYGNNDLERASLAAAADEHGIALSDPPLHLELGGRSLSVVHDPLDIQERWLAKQDVVLHGHNHRTVIERRGGCLVFNPGECAGIMAGHNRIGVLDLSTRTPELLHF